MYDKVLYIFTASLISQGECLAGALQWKDLSTIATEVGFVTPVLVKSTVLTCSDAAIQKLQGIVRRSYCDLCVDGICSAVLISLKILVYMQTYRL